MSSVDWLMRRHERGCPSPLQQGTAIHPLSEAQGLSGPLDVMMRRDSGHPAVNTEGLHFSLSQFLFNHLQRIVYSA